MSIAEHLDRAIEKHRAKTKEKKHSEHPMEMKRMAIEPEDGGDGYIVTHYPEPFSGKSGGGGSTFLDSYMRESEPTRHVMKNHRDLMKHVKEHCCPDASDVEESAVSH
jgi:hypothetical protein